jgi:hypothetical protein
MSTSADSGGNLVRSLMAKAKDSGMNVHGVVLLTAAQSEEVFRLTGVKATSLTFGSLDIGDVRLVTMPVMSW